MNMNKYSVMDKQPVIYENYENKNNVTHGLKDKIIIDKELFITLLLNEAKSISQKEEKDIMDINIADILNSLYSKRNSSETISLTRFYKRADAK